MSKNSDLISQWSAGLNAEKALNEIKALKQKYPWLKCDETLKFVEKMNSDLPKIIQIVKLQETQNKLNEGIIHAHYYADEAIVRAAATRLGIEL